MTSNGYSIEATSCEMEVDNRIGKTRLSRPNPDEENPETDASRE